MRRDPVVVGLLVLLATQLELAASPTRGTTPTVDERPLLGEPNNDPMQRTTRPTNPRDPSNPVGPVTY